MPKVYIAGDHAGFALKQALLAYLAELGWEAEDLGAYAFHSDDDYPDFITPLAQKVAEERDTVGIVIGGSGQGEAMAANRIKGARAAVFYGPRAAAAEQIDIEGHAGMDEYDIIHLARLHNDANILSIGARFVAEAEAREAVRIFLATSFSGEARHARRIAKF